MRPPRKIVICCDGTGNSFENLCTDSNVVKLYSSLTLNEEQIGYYHPGVGTMGAPNKSGWINKKWSVIKGLAFGEGLMANVGDAYRYLMDNYSDGDQIYLFGFSRGSYTARVLASLIHVFGLLCAGNHELIPYILNLYSKRSNDAKHKRQGGTPFPSTKGAATIRTIFGAMRCQGRISGRYGSRAFIPTSAEATRRAPADFPRLLSNGCWLRHRRLVS